MSTIRNIFVTLLLLFISGNSFSQEHVDSVRNEELLSFGMGMDLVLDNSSRQYSFSLAYFDRDLSKYLGGRALVLASIHNELWKYNTIVEVSPLYGKGLTWGNTNLFAAIGLSLIGQHFSGGVRQNPEAMFSRYTYQEPITKVTVGLPVHLQFTHKVGTKTGISLLSYANINPIQHFFGATVNLLFFF